MAIETTIQLSENKFISDAYVKINNPRSYKLQEKMLMLVYDIECYSEKNGARLNSYFSETEYSGGDIWNEAYTHLKTTAYKDSKDV